MPRSVPQAVSGTTNDFPGETKMKKMNAGDFVFHAKYWNSAAISKNERSIGMRTTNALRASVSAILLTFFLLPAAAHAANVNVVCPGGGVGAFPNINAALNTLDPHGPNTITVSGACVENIF